MLNLELLSWGHLIGVHVLLAPEDNMKIWDTLKNWKQVQAMLPALAEAVLGMARSEKQWIADIPKYYEQLLKDALFDFPLKMSPMMSRASFWPALPSMRWRQLAKCRINVCLASVLVPIAIMTACSRLRPSVIFSAHAAAIRNRTLGFT